MVDVAQTLETLLMGYPQQIKLLRAARFEPPNQLYGTLQVTPGWLFDASQFAPGELAELMSVPGQKLREEQTPVNHFTAVEAQVGYNQLAYVALACMAQDGHFEGVNPLSLAAMNKKKFNDMVIRTITHDFKAPFDGTKPFDAVFEVSSQKLKRTQSGVYVIARTKFSFDGDKAYGESVAAVRVHAYELKNPESV